MTLENTVTPGSGDKEDKDWTDEVKEPAVDFKAETGKHYTDSLCVLTVCIFQIEVGPNHKIESHDDKNQLSNLCIELSER